MTIMRLRSHTISESIVPTSADYGHVLYTGHPASNTFLPDGITPAKTTHKSEINTRNLLGYTGMALYLCDRFQNDFDHNNPESKTLVKVNDQTQIVHFLDQNKKTICVDLFIHDKLFGRHAPHTELKNGHLNSFIITDLSGRHEKPIKNPSQTLTQMLRYSDELMGRRGQKHDLLHPDACSYAQTRFSNKYGVVYVADDGSEHRLKSEAENHSYQRFLNKNTYYNDVLAATYVLDMG